VSASRRRCQKIRYTDRAEAAIAQAALAKRGQRMKAYWCEPCGALHLATYAADRKTPQAAPAPQRWKVPQFGGLRKNETKALSVHELEALRDQLRRDMELSPYAVERASYAKAVRWVADEIARRQETQAALKEDAQPVRKCS
jgi:hypothetical protein